MELKLAVSDYSFPLLKWEQSLNLAHEIGMDGVDLGLFADGSHLRPQLGHVSHGHTLIARDHDHTSLAELLVQLTDLLGFLRSIHLSSP